MGFRYEFKPDFLESQRVADALGYAMKMHEGQFRKNKSVPYIVHPINVADNVRHFFNMYPDNGTYDMEAMLMAAYLHDTLEDTEATYDDLVERFGHKVASIVLELTTDKKVQKTLGKTKYLSEKMISMSDEALIIKLCDRLDNTSDLLEMDKSFSIKYRLETYGILISLGVGRVLKPIQTEIGGCILKQLRTSKKCNNNTRYLGMKSAA